MNNRDPLMPPEYFVKRLEYIDESIASRLAKLRDQPEVYKKPQAFLRANFRDRYEQVFMGYSLGEDVRELARRFPAVVDAYEAHIRGPGMTPHVFSDLDRYLVSLWLVSFALIFKVDDALWNRLLACIGNEGQDALYESLVATLTPNRVQAKGLSHPKIFEPLFKAISAKGESRDAFLKRYLKDWYGAFSNTYWHEAHKGPEGGGFFGYWAVEVAGVAAAFNMDDRAFRDMPYYPKDLVG